MSRLIVTNVDTQNIKFDSDTTAFTIASDGTTSGVGAGAMVKLLDVSNISSVATYDIDSTYTKTRTEGFGLEVKRRIMLGTFVLSAGYYDAYYTKALKVRRLIKEKTDEIFKGFDLIMLPSTPTTAFGLNEIKDPIKMYLQDIFTVHANLSGVPEISIPVAQHTNNMPFGIQLMANRFEEEKLLACASYMMNELH